jgi:hypothetical protein
MVVVRKMELCCQDGGIVHWPYRRKKSGAVAIDSESVVVLLTASAWERGKVLAKLRKAVVVALYDRPTRLLALRKAVLRVLEWKIPEDVVRDLNVNTLVSTTSGGTRDAFFARLCGGNGEVANWKKRKKPRKRTTARAASLESEHLRALAGKKRVDG